MGRLVDLTGKVFGRLTVIERRGSDDAHNAMWFVRCECGVTKTLPGVVMRSGNTRSCGCLFCDSVRANSITHGATVNRHEAVEYKAWKAMLYRCKYPRRHPYHAGRGIQVCRRWKGPKGYTAFRSDVGPRPSPKYSLDRYPDNNGNYRPGNVRWATKQQQALNSRRCHMITAVGQSKSLGEWAKALGLRQEALRHRIDRGWPIELAVTVPPTPRGRRFFT